MNQLQFIRQSLRLPSLMAGLSTVMGGTAIAAVRDNIHPLPLILSTVFILMAQLASNSMQAFNDLRTHHGNTANEEIAGRMHRKEDTMMYEILREIGVGCFLIAMTIGVVLAGYAGEWVLLAGAMVVILGYLNVQGPFPLIQTPFGPLVTFLLFGPIGVIGVFLMQFSDASFAILSWFDIGPAVYLSCTVGLFAAIVQITEEYPKYRSSILTHRTSYVTEVGRRASRVTVLLCGIGMWAVFFLMISTFYTQHPIVDMVMPTVGLAVTIYIVRMMGKYPRHESPYKINDVALWNMFIVMFTTMLLFMTIGAPDVSIRDMVLY